MLTRPLILASASPRRADLLAQIGVPCRVLPAEIEEPPPAPGEDVRAWACAMAAAKARAVAPRLAEPALILGADTMVLLPAREDDPMGQLPRLRGLPVHVLGKPADAAEARSMLQALSGRTHVVLSAFALYRHPEAQLETDAVETTVTFRPLSSRDIEAYLATGEPLDKAGAYGIQGRGAVLIDRIDGDYATVVGLPLSRLWEQLAAYIS